jgi:hypothetical protein
MYTPNIRFLLAHSQNHSMADRAGQAGRQEYPAHPEENRFPMLWQKGSLSSFVPRISFLFM